MGYKINPFTGNLDEVGGGGGSVGWEYPIGTWQSFADNQSNVTNNTAINHTSNNLIGSFFVLENDTDIDSLKVDIGGAAGTECVVGIYNYDALAQNWVKEHEIPTKINTAITGVQVVVFPSITLTAGVKALFTNSNGTFLTKGNNDVSEKCPIGHNTDFSYKSYGFLPQAYASPMPATISDPAMTYLSGFPKRLVLFKIA